MQNSSDVTLEAGSRGAEADESVHELTAWTGLVNALHDMNTALVLDASKSALQIEALKEQVATLKTELKARPARPATRLKGRKDIGGAGTDEGKRAAFEKVKVVWVKAMLAWIDANFVSESHDMLLQAVLKSPRFKGFGEFFHGTLRSCEKKSVANNATTMRTLMEKRFATPAARDFGVRKYLEGLDVATILAVLPVKARKAVSDATLQPIMDYFSAPQLAARLRINFNLSDRSMARLRYIANPPQSSHLCAPLHTLLLFDSYHPCAVTCFSLG